jgi:hypothetical protein
MMDMDVQPIIYVVNLLCCIKLVVIAFFIHVLLRFQVAKLYIRDLALLRSPASAGRIKSKEAVVSVLDVADCANWLAGEPREGRFLAGMPVRGSASKVQVRI